MCLGQGIESDKPLIKRRGVGEDGSCERRLLTRACPQAAYRTSRLPISSGKGYRSTQRLNILNVSSRSLKLKACLTCSPDFDH